MDINKVRGAAAAVLAALIMLCTEEWGQVFAETPAVTVKTDTASAEEVCTEKVEFSVYTGESGKRGFGSLVVSLDNFESYDPDAAYSVSINGGRSFIPVTKGVFRFGKLKKGSYNICVMKNGDESTRSDIKAVYVGDEDAPVKILCEGIAAQGYKDGQIVIHIENYSADKGYIYSVDGGITWHDVKAASVRINGVRHGSFAVCVKSKKDPSEVSPTVELKVPFRPVSQRKTLKAALIKQNPELPTGCEVTSLAMALKYYNFNIKPTVLADYFLDKGEYRASDYRKVFVGNPREIAAYGCYSGVIVKCAKKFLSTVKERSYDVINLTGCSAEELYTYIDMDIPVIVWATSKMIPTAEGPSWTDAETGETITWVANEHCLLLTGYDKEKGIVYLNDPQYGAVGYKTELFEQRFAELGNQAVVIVDVTE
ncbi:MAG: C39 family peptidase [Huintestinicola sp.]